MQFHETTALGSVASAPEMATRHGKPCCQFLLVVDAPSKDTPRKNEFHCRVIGDNAAKCWSSLKKGDEVAVTGLVYAEAVQDESGEYKPRMNMRCNFIRYSQDVLNRVDGYKLA